MVLETVKLGKIAEREIAREHDALRRYIQRATWTLSLVILALVVALLAIRHARVTASDDARRAQTVAREAVSAELDATRAQSAIRLYLVSGNLESLERSTAGLASAFARLDSLRGSMERDSEAQGLRAAADTALRHWQQNFVAIAAASRPGESRTEIPALALHGDTLFDAVRAGFGSLVQVAQQRSARRLQTVHGLELASLSMFVLGAVVLAALVVQMTRRLKAQVLGAERVQQTIARQNEKLLEQYGLMESQTEILQEQAAELEAQQADLQTQAIELEATVDELREVQRSEHELLERTQQLNRRLAEAQHVAKLGYWEVDSETKRVFWSDEMYKFCGAPLGTVPPPTDLYLTCVHPEDRSRLARLAERALNEQSEFTEQYRLRDAAGRVRTVLANGRLITDPNGRRKLVGTVQDISDRVRLEDQLRQSQKMEAVGTLAGGVAHDFNNILTVIMSYTGILLNELSPEEKERRENLAEINRASARAAELTRHLLTFSRQQVVQPRVLPLNDALRDIERMLRRLIPENISLELQLEATRSSVSIDPVQLEQIIVNLAVNARDAMPNGGVFEVSTRNVALRAGQAPLPVASTGGNFVLLAVRDTGHGMNDATQARIFEPFFTTKPQGKGTGLGLSTVYGIVHQAGGHLLVQSEVGSGTTFLIYFPVVASADEPGTREIFTDATPERGTETILLVEDEAAVRGATRTLLRQVGYTVLEAENGEAALDVFTRQQRTIDLVITDMIMPGINGRELGQRLRAFRPDLPVLVTSGYTDDEILRRDLHDTRTTFIQKPYSIRDLSVAIRQALEGTTSEKPDAP